MAGNETTNNKLNSGDPDIDMLDLEDISLDELDGFDSIDFDNLDLDDIDFDDIDVTSLDTGVASPKREEKAESDEYDFDSLLAGEDTQTGTEDSDNVSFDTGIFDDAEKAVLQDTSVEAMDYDELDELFRSIDMEDEKTSAASAAMPADNEDYSSAGTDFDELFKQSMELSMEGGELDDIQDISEIKKSSSEKKKKSLNEILFGEPDEDDAEEERLLAEKKAQNEIKKAEKNQKKEEKKALKDAKKQEALAIKEKESQAKGKAKAEKKAAAEAEYMAELEAEKGEKQVPTIVVIIVFALFAALGVFVVFGTKAFDYNRLIKKATEYFDREKYRMAYDEIAGVDVKKEDEELKDRIYTVMYVERLYESYENNIKLGRADKALDALIRGLEKYDEHYEEAVELNIVKDIDVCKKKIISALWSTYSMSEQEAIAIMALEGQEYTKALETYCAGMTGE